MDETSLRPVHLFFLSVKNPNTVCPRNGLEKEVVFHVEKNIP
jgi:hypothetical protein